MRPSPECKPGKRITRTLALDQNIRSRTACADSSVRNRRGLVPRRRAQALVGEEDAAPSPVGHPRRTALEVLVLEVRRRCPWLLSPVWKPLFGRCQGWKARSACSVGEYLLASFGPVALKATAHLPKQLLLMGVVSAPRYAPQCRCSFRRARWIVMKIPKPSETPVIPHAPSCPSQPVSVVQVGYEPLCM